MKYFVILLLFVSFSSYGKSKWQKHYDIVVKDIKTVEALKTKDLMLRVRLFELYGEKLTLLLEKENEYRIKYVETGSKKGLNNVLNLQKKTLRSIESIAKKIERQTKKKRILAKVYYYRALNFYLVKDYKRFYRNIKKAEKINKDKSIAYIINTKLADYHYNEKQYKPAERYYKKLLYNKRNKWLTKIYYNLAWSQLKLDKAGPALANLKTAHKLSRKKYYFQIGDQLIDAILLFHAYAKKTKVGLDYMLAHGINDFDNLLKYLHYIFENGSKTSTKYVIAHFDKMKLTADQEYKLLTKKILIYRTLKRFSSIQREFKVFRKKLKVLLKKKKDKRNEEELINGVKSYTGYLQELVRSKRLVNKKRKKIYVKYVAYNFNILKKIDRKNALEYNYYEGETYFLMRNYRRASFVYASGINKYKKLNKKRRDKFLDKSFDSLFKSLEKLKKPPAKTLLFAYNSYLYFYPTGPKSALVYQKLINFYRVKNNEKKMFATLRKYNKYYPKDINKQRGVYKDILNRYIKMEDIASLVKLKGIVEKNFLKFTKAEIVKLDKIINQIHFKKYDDMAKAGKYTDAIAGFFALYQDEKNEYNIRYNALLKKMFYENKTQDLENLTDTMKTTIGFFRRKEKLTHKNEILFYAQNICISDLHKNCLEVTNRIKKDKSIKMSKELDNLSFKVFTILNDVDDSIFAKATTFERKNYLFKFLLASDPNFRSPLYNQMYKFKQFRMIIDPSIEQNFWRYYFARLDLSAASEYINKISITSIKNNYNKLMGMFDRNITKTKFVLPAPPKVKEITFEVFQKYNQALEAAFINNVKSVDDAIRILHPNFLPQFLSQVVINFEKESQKIKNYIPISKDAELEKAISNRVLELNKILDLKLVEYRTLYNQALDKTSVSVGSRRYYEDVMTAPVNYGLGRVIPWQD